MNYIGMAGLKYKDAEYDPVSKAEKIIALVEERLTIVSGMTKQKTRKREIAYARQLAMYLIHRTTSLSLKSIGLLFKRDHTTVIHANNTIKDLLHCYEYVRDDISELMEQIK